MNRKLYLIFLILFVLLSVIACSTENGESVAEIAQENIPSLTNTPQPTDTPILPTNTPMPTATSTLVPTPTVEVCDRVVLEKAIAMLNELESYQGHLTMTSDAELFEGEPLMEADTVFLLKDGLLEQAAITINLSFNEAQIMEMIFTQKQLYFKPSVDDEWETVEGAIASEMLNRLTGAQIIKPQVMSNLDFANCQVSYEEIGGTEAKLYAFSDISLEGITNITGELVVEDPNAVSGKSLILTLLPYEDFLLAVKMEMVMEFFEFEEVYEVTAVQEIHSINELVEIAIPDVTSPTFSLDIPLDETAVVTLEREDVITFALLGEPELILEEYLAFFVESGWLEGDHYEEELQGIVFQAIEFSKENQTLTLLVGESEGNVFVILGLEGLDRFLNIPILPDSVIEDEFPDESLIYRSQLSHDEILEFYTSTLEAEGWTLKNWGTEIYEDYSVTLRLYEKDGLVVRVGISQREDGTLVYIFRE